MTTLAAYFHTLDPVVLQIAPGFAVRWYGLSYVAGFIIGWFVLFQLARKRLVELDPPRVADAIMWLVFGVLLGGRIGYCLVYDPALLASFTDHFPFWGFLAINRGGMASHGAIVGCVLAAWRVSKGWPDGPRGERIGRTSMLHIMDCLAVISPFGLFLGRIANFINGELLGRIVTPPGIPGPWWTVQFPQELSGWTGPGARDLLSHTPELTDQQQAALNALVASQSVPGEKWAVTLDRLIDRAAQFRDQLQPLVSCRHPSQLYQAAAEGLALGLVVWGIWAWPRKPGVVAAWWLMVYGVLRVLTEVWRLPDAQFGAAGRILGLSRGQWLSVGMVVCGAALLTWAVRRTAKPIGGWLRRAPQSSADATLFAR